jgi:precorrin-3B methylase
MCRRDTLLSRGDADAGTTGRHYTTEVTMWGMGIMNGDLIRETGADAQTRGALVVVGTGIQWGGQTTLAAERAIRTADAVLFAVADPWTARWIRSLNQGATALPYPRDGRPRRDIYRQMTAHILAALERSPKVCAVFYGSPTFLAHSAHEALRAARDRGFSAAMLPGISSLECMAADLGIDFGERGCQIYEANVFLSRPRSVDTSAYLIVCQVAMIGHATAFDGDTQRVRRGLERLSERLQATYPPEHPVWLYEAARHPAHPPKLIGLALANLASASISEVATLCVPPAAEATLEARVVS